jgi:hypothetical protein
MPEGEINLARPRIFTTISFGKLGKSSLIRQLTIPVHLHGSPILVFSSSSRTFFPSFAMSSAVLDPATAAPTIAVS